MNDMIKTLRSAGCAAYLLTAAVFLTGCDGEGESKDVEVASTDADEFWGSVPCEDLTTEASCTARGCRFNPIGGVFELSAGTCSMSFAPPDYGLCEGGFGGSAVPCFYQHDRSGRMMGQAHCGPIVNWTAIFSPGLESCSPDVKQGEVSDARDCFCVDGLVEIPWENKEALSKEDSQP